MTAQQCVATTAAGFRCINPAQRGVPVCATHSPSRWCGKPTRYGEPCRRPKTTGRDTCTLHA